MNVVDKTLPQDLTPYELEDWLKNNSIEHFTDEVKNYFSPEEIQEFEHESSLNGRSKNKMEDLLKTVTAAIKKGLTDDDGPLTIEIPVSIGTDKLDKVRRQNDDFIDRGYETEELEVYGILNAEDETVEYFTLTGRKVAERTRQLSPKEKMKHLGVKNISMGTGLKAAANE